MRADRLLAILLILQTRGKTTAQALAAELEVSERTIYRDMVALSTSGVPVYTEKGPGGGIALIEDYRTELTGLTSQEANALYLVQALSPLKELGMESALANAMRKLQASLSDEQLRLSDQSARLIHFDTTPWKEPQQGGPMVQSLHKCMVSCCRVNLTIRQINAEKAVFLVEPYGLVAKGGDWLLACKIKDSMQIIRLDDVLGAAPVEDGFERDAAFDLQSFWGDWLEINQRSRREFKVTVLISPALLPYTARISDQVEDQEDIDEDGWRKMTFTFRSHYQARARLLPFGGAVKVLEPLALRLAMVDLAEQFIKVNGGS